MKRRFFTVVGLLMAFTFIIGLLPSCQPALAASSYIAVLPKVLHSGRTEAIALSLFAGDTLTKEKVEVILLKDGKKIASAKQTIDGKGTVSLNIPEVADGKYEIQVKGSAFSDKASINVENSFLVFIESDKPIYKPGQTIHMRVLTLDPELKPVTGPVTVGVLDAKGIKIFQSLVTTDEYGMASIDLPLSDEPNLGVWKINAVTEKTNNQLDVRVEEYVLPKYEVTVDLPREWFLVSEPIKGKIGAEYSFGKPVSGEATIVATRYVGQWEQYATLTKDIDGEIDFELPAAGYVAGTPASGGQGNVQLDITVTEKSTGYVEKTSRLVTVAQSVVNLQLIPEGSVFKPGLPFNVLILTETPDNQPVDSSVSVTITYMDDNFKDFKTETKKINTAKGKALLELAPPAEAIALMLEANSGDNYISRTIQSSYSPSGNFIHLEQVTEGTMKIGQKISFKVYSTDRSTHFYYEVLSRGMVVFSDYTTNKNISFSVTPLMAPSAKLLVYQILPNAEVAADYLPFKVEAAYPMQVTAEFSRDEAKPAEDIDLKIKTDGKAKVGIAAVDKSVFILAENRLNLQQVFDELERLYMEPQAEIHEVSFYPTYTVPGAEDIFKDAGVMVMTNKKLPQSKEYQAENEGGIWSRIVRFFGGDMMAMEKADGLNMAIPAPTIILQQPPSGSQLAEVQRVRQFFPETWLWLDLETDSSGKVTQQVTVPDSITTWMLRAVAISKEKGLGVAETSLKVFQPFFLTIDLPYSAIRGEEFPVSVAVYNYLDTPQDVQVEIEKSNWFELLDSPIQTINIPANDIGSVEFNIRPVKLGINDVKMSARSADVADAVIKTIIIEPEGVPREIIDNLTLTGGITKSIDTSIPDVIVEDSARAYFAVTSSFLTQTIDGLDALLQMPFGCGEQNMIVFAPDVFITKYLQSSGQLKPEIMAKAEKLMITGYQRELTYRRTDGSFSAFGMNDESGSLWLTAFVLKCFSQAKGLLYIDDSVLDTAKEWITSHQKADGSFEQVGFVHHQEMLGGLKGKEALTAYTAIALMEAGEKDSSGRAVRYLEGKLDGMTDPYAVAITAYALELADSPVKDEAYDKLMSLSKEDEDGLHWGSDGIIPLPEPQEENGGLRKVAPFRPDVNASSDIETTAYATLALVRHGDAFNASRASKWLVSKRNAYGGYGSTQDTVVTLQALIEYATGSRSDVDLTVTLKGEGIDKKLRINKDNFDVLQIVPVPVDADIEMTVEGKGDAIAQVVRRFNLPETDDTPAAQMLKIDVKYDTTEVEVNDLVTVDVALTFTPLPELNISEAGMIVLDVSVPTGFEAVTDSIVAVTQKMANIKRFDISGRKVIFYVENMKPGQHISFDFQVRALYPVKAKGVLSTAFSYYRPDIKGETLGEAVTVF